MGEGMSGPTPGPWVWTDGTDPINIATYEAPGYYKNPELRGANGDMVVGCDEYDVIGPFTDHGAYVANARLIAAAPDMLDVLEDAFHAIEHDSLRERIRTVIAKATGEAQP